MADPVEVMARALDPVAWNAYQHAVKERGACTESEIALRYMNTFANARAAHDALKAAGYAVVPVEPTRVSGMEFVAEVPKELGAIRGMRVEGDRIVCQTESGIEYILHGDPEKVVTAKRVE